MIIFIIILEKNRYRRYTMDLQLSLFGGVYLTTSCGKRLRSATSRKETTGSMMRAMH